MTSEAVILKVLSEADVTPVGSILSGKEGHSVYFVTVAVSRDSSGKQIPTNAALHSAAKALGEAGVKVEFLLRYEEAEAIESGLRATILHSHIDHIRNIFVSFQFSKAKVWLEPKHPLEPALIIELEGRAQTFLALFDIELSELFLTTEQILPSKIAILTTIRQFAPASLTAIAVELHKRNLTVPSPDWLVRRLDSLRKSAHVVRLASGEFVLTTYSLHRLGTAKNRRSPDISRLLALAKRGS